MQTLKEQLLGLMVCSLCGHPAEWDRQDRVYRHKEPQAGTAAAACRRYGYPVTPVMRPKDQK